MSGADKHPAGTLIKKLEDFVGMSVGTVLSHTEGNDYYEYLMVGGGAPHTRIFLMDVSSFKLFALTDAPFPLMVTSSHYDVLIVDETHMVIE